MNMENVNYLSPFKSTLLEGGGGLLQILAIFSHVFAFLANLSNFGNDFTQFSDGSMRLCDL